MVGRAACKRKWLVVAGLAAASLPLFVPRGTAAEVGANQASCPMSHVHYSRDTTADGGLRSIPWIATAPGGMFHAHLFLYGGMPWPRLRLLGARIFTTVKTRSVSPKVLWTSRRPGSAATLSISGKRLDKPGHFSGLATRVPGNQFHSYVEVPQAGCWRVTVKSGKLVGAVTFAAVDSF
jgi:hypothetical protein